MLSNVILLFHSERLHASFVMPTTDMRSYEHIFPAYKAD
jgi:hypothetical protein